MNIHFKLFDSLPKLSWCAKLEKGKNYMDVFHGPWVETRTYTFVEGAWDGPFDEGKFEESTVLMGSDGKVTKNRVLFTSPYYTTERLHCVKTNDTLYVSNSLAFILKYSGLSLDINYIPYVADFASVSKGIKKYKNKIPTKDGPYINIFYYSNIEIDKELNIYELEKPLSPDFKNFKSYYDFILESLKKISQNAKNPNRKIRYLPLTTISTGYDSAACAALALEIGCTTSITLAKPKKYEIDGGKELAKKFGYKNIKEFDADSFKSLPDFPEAEFLATGELGTDIFFTSFEKELPGKLVLTGVHVDKVWDKNNKHVTRQILRSSPAATSLSEFRLRVGFIHVPIPFFGCINHPYIHRISNSDEMQPWILDNKYDRPIPRRIIEEKGIKRKLFGFKKVGAGFNLQWDTLTRLRKRMNPNSFNDFIKFYKANKRKPTLVKPFICKSLYLFSVGLIVINKILDKLKCPLKIPTFPHWCKYSCNPGAPSYLIHWGISVISKRYEIE